MRASRLIRMVLLLQHRRGMTAAELAAELDVSERTVARDVSALSEAGVPVYAERGRTGGYRLVGGYRTGLTGLTRDEAEALFLSGVPAALRETGLAEAGTAARLKVSAALSPELRDASEQVARRFHLDAPGWWRGAAAPPLLAALAEAVRDDRPVTACYRRPEGVVERWLEPYGLVLKAGVWYLAAAARPERPEGVPLPGSTREPAKARRAPAAHRVYRVDRFTAVEPLPGRFVREPDFDLAAFWSERAAAFARSVLRTEAVVRLTPAGVRRLPAVHGDRAVVARAVAAAEPHGDAEGRVTVVLPVESLDVAYSQVLGLGADAEVLAPPELRNRLARAARLTAARYEGG